MQAWPARTGVLVIDEIAVNGYDKKLDDGFISTVEPGEHRIGGCTYSLEERNM